MLVQRPVPGRLSSPFGYRKNPIKRKRGKGRKKRKQLKRKLHKGVDFVARRGGGLLLLGGRRAFAEGGYGRPPLADRILQR